MRSLPFLAFGVSTLVSCALVRAQVNPGEALVSAEGFVKSGNLNINGDHLIVVDPLRGTATRLGGTTQYANGRGVLLDGPATGFWGKDEVDRFVITAGNNLTLTRWNTSAHVGRDFRDFAIVNDRLYYVSWESATETNRLYSLPVTAPGAPRLELDLRAAGYVISQTRMTRAGSRLYVAGRNRADTAMTIVEFDVAASTHRKFHERTLTIGHVELIRSSGSELWLLGQQSSNVVRGFAVDLATAQETRSVHYAMTDGLDLPRNGVYNPDSGDLLVGDRRGNLEVYVMQGPIGARAPAGGHARGVVQYSGGLNAEAFGMDHIPAGGSYPPFGGGCVGAQGRTPTSFGFGSGKVFLDFRLGIRGEANAFAVVVIGRNQWNFDLGTIGAPGCFLRSDGSIITETLRLGPNGEFDVLVPGAALGFPLYTQWGVLDRSNALGVSMSDARTLTFRP